MGVVHRDVTPANVLVAKTGEAKLVDFGLVLANTRLFRTQTGIARGTLPYMSPEQAAGELVDFRADLYSATASLYELLTGVRAFQGSTAAETSAAILHLAPPALASLGVNAGAEVERILRRCLAKKPERRFSSARTLALALRALLARSETPLPATTLYRPTARRRC